MHVCQDVGVGTDMTYIVFNRLHDCVTQNLMIIDNNDYACTYSVSPQTTLVTNSCNYSYLNKITHYCACSTVYSSWRKLDLYV